MSSGSPEPDPPQELWIPSREDTDQAIAGIKEGRLEEPARILQHLATAVVRTVTEIDQVYGASRYLVSLQVICKAPGVFELVIYDKNAEIDSETLAQLVARQLDEEDPLKYHKPLRPIELGIITKEELDGGGTIGPAPDPISGMGRREDDRSRCKGSGGGPDYGPGE